MVKHKNNKLVEATTLIANVSTVSWQHEIEKISGKYHEMAAWVAILFNPLFAIVDCYNIPQHWSSLLVTRLLISAITLVTLYAGKYFKWPSFIVVLVPLVLISLQNAYTYSFITNDELLGHNLNYMALLIGAALFIVWETIFSVAIVVMSTVMTSAFIINNDTVRMPDFLVGGGLLLIMTSIFMVVLIRLRYDLTVKEIKARLALQSSYEEILAQDEEIKGINENLENIVRDRTRQLEMKNRTLEEYAFINAHQLRSPVASILGLINLMRKIEMNAEAKTVMNHLHESTEKLDRIVASISRTIESGDGEKN